MQEFIVVGYPGSVAADSALSRDFPEGALATSDQVREALGFALYDRVRVAHGAREGKAGTVVAWGRDKDANQRYARSHDPEYLIETEGPVVQYDDGEQDWWPGQSMSGLDLDTEPAKRSLTARAVMDAIADVIQAHESRLVNQRGSAAWGEMRGSSDLPILAYTLDNRVYSVTVVRYGEDLAGGVDLLLEPVSA